MSLPASPKWRAIRLAVYFVTPGMLPVGAAFWLLGFNALHVVLVSAAVALAFDGLNDRL